MVKHAATPLPLGSKNTPILCRVGHPLQVSDAVLMSFVDAAVCTDPTGASNSARTICKAISKALAKAGYKLGERAIANRRKTWDRGSVDRSEGERLLHGLLLELCALTWHSSCCHLS